MEPGEAKEVKKLGIRSFRSFESLFVPAPKEALVAIKDSKVVAAVIIKFIRGKNNQKTGYVDFAFVDPAFHNQGIGRQLYKAAVYYLWRRGCSQITALVKDDNVGSWSLFLKNGFQRVSLYTLIKTLGVKGFLNHVLHTPMAFGPGNDVYMAGSSENSKTRKDNSLWQIFLYLSANLLISLFVIFQIGAAKTLLFAGVVFTVLAVGTLTGYLGTAFSKRKWKFRFANCGFLTSILLFLLRAAFPMIGNWYPVEYEKTKEFRRDMGIQSLTNWLGYLVLALAAGILSPYSQFCKLAFIISSVLMSFRILAFYPFSVFGGTRVLHWNKIVYGVTALLSILVMVVGAFV
jgi:GNAT superfamily N-acetyltransferase